MRKWMFQIGLVLITFLAIGVGCDEDEQPKPPTAETAEFEPFSF